MPYRSPRSIERQRALSQSLANQPMGRGKGSGIAHILRNLGAYQGGRAASRAEEESTGIRQEELARLLREIQNPPQPELQQLNGPEGLVSDLSPPPQPYQSDVGEMATMHQLGLARDKAKTAARLKQRANLGDPAAIREWNIYSQMSKEDQEKYLGMKRANRPIDTGPGWVTPSQTDPTKTTPLIDKDLTPEQEPEYLRRIAREKEAIRLSGLGIQQGMEVPHAGKMATATSTAQKEVDLKYELPQARLQVQLVGKTVDNMVRGIDEILDHPGLDNATGWLFGRIPTVSQEGRNAIALMDTLKNQIFMTSLQEMKRASGTGASGLGQLTEKEGERLENNIAALDASQDTETYKDQLRVIKREALSGKDIHHSMFNEVYGVRAPAAPAAPTPPETIQVGKFKVRVGP